MHALLRAVPVHHGKRAGRCARLEEEGLLAREQLPAGLGEGAGTAGRGVGGRGRAGATDPVWLTCSQPHHAAHAHACAGLTPTIACRRRQVGNGFIILRPKQECGLPDREAATDKEEARRRYLAASLGNPDKAAAERLEARAMLLAGQAGLCCNPRCTAGCRVTPCYLQTTS